MYIFKSKVIPGIIIILGNMCIIYSSKSAKNATTHNASRNYNVNKKSHLEFTCSNSRLPAIWVGRKKQLTTLPPQGSIHPSPNSPPTMFTAEVFLG